MKILHLLQSPFFSGAENVVCQIISAFQDDSNYEMVYCSPKGPIESVLKERGIKYEPIESLNISEIKRVIKKIQPDYIHAHDMNASFKASLTSSQAKLISHIHNNNIENRGISLKSLAFLLPAWKASHIYYVSRSSYKDYFFHKLFERKSSVLYNVLNIDELNEKKEKRGKLS